MKVPRKIGVVTSLLVATLPVGLLISQRTAGQEVTRDSSTYTCLIEPTMTLKLGSPVPGLISEVLVDRGAMVKKGQVLALLESGVETAIVALAKARAENNSAVQSAQIKLEFQSRKAARATELQRGDNIALSKADEDVTGSKIAEADLHEAEINVQLAKLDLERSVELLKQRTIRSPIDGVVTERTLGPGEYAFDQAHLFTLAQIDPLSVEAFVPLIEFGLIRVGMRAIIYPEKPIGGKYDATVTVVDKVFDAASGTIGIRLELANHEYNLPAGLKCQVRFSGIG